MQRVFGLDLIRSVSIWLVLIQHAGILMFGLNGCIKIGAVGVDVFFVLSGFLIGGILIRDLSRENSIHSIKKFLIRRWFRILPVYYLCLLVKFIFFDHSIGLNIFYYLFFLQNNFYGIGFYDVTWSLVIEEWFYLFTPFFLLIMIRIFKNPAKILPSILLFLLFENCMRYGYVYIRHAPYSGINSNFPFRFDSLFLGVMMAYIKIYFPYYYQKFSGKIALLSGFLIFAGYIYYLSLNSSQTGLIDKLILPRTFGFFILDFGIALMIPFFDNMKSINRSNFFTNFFYQFITWTSLLTYSIYLLHEPVNSLMSFLKIDFFSFPVIFLCASAVTYFFAYLLYRFFEKPILDLREKFV